MEGARLICVYVSGQETSQNPNGCLENLWPRIDIKGNPFYHVLDRTFEAPGIIEDNERVQYIYECQGEVSGNIICCNVGSWIELVNVVHDECTRLTHAFSQSGPCPEQLNGVNFWRDSV